MIDYNTLPKCKSSEILADDLNTLNNKRFSNKILSVIETNKKVNRDIKILNDETRNVLADLWLQESKRRIRAIKTYSPDIPQIIYTTATSIVTGLYRDILRMKA